MSAQDLTNLIANVGVPLAITLLCLLFVWRRHTQLEDRYLQSLEEEVTFYRTNFSIAAASPPASPAFMKEGYRREPGTSLATTNGHAPEAVPVVGSQG